MKNDSEIAERRNMIVEQCEGIQHLYEPFYIHSIIYAAESSIEAFQRFEEAVVREEEDAKIFATLQEALMHGAALSRYFWPTKQNDALAVARGKNLRKKFSLNESSPLKNRKLRNMLEHFDEDLDKFLLKDLAGFFFPTPIVGSHTLSDDPIGNIFKLVDPCSGVCILLGEKFEFFRIRDEVLGVLNQAIKAG